MNEAEVRTMLNALSTNYKGFVRPGTDKRAMLQNWLSAFEFVQPEAGMAAARQYMQQNKFPPTIADVFELVPPNAMDERRYDTEKKIERMRAMYQSLQQRNGAV